MERDALQNELRERETKILNMNRDLDEIREQYEKADRVRLQQQRELDDLMSSKDDVGKSVSVAFIQTLSQAVNYMLNGKTFN